MKFENDPRRRMEFGGFYQWRPIDLQNKLRSMSERSSQKAVAKLLGISAQYLSDTLHGRREISSAVAQKIGFERVVTFVRFGDEVGE